MTGAVDAAGPGGGRSASVAGLLLAAGAGRRMGMPKALVRGDDGEAWVVRGARLLVEAGCSPVIVVVGARADEVEAVLEAGFGAGSGWVSRREPAARSSTGGVGRGSGWVSRREPAARSSTGGDGGVRVVRATNWADGMSASLLAGIGALEGSGAERGEGDEGVDAEAVLVTLVDLPELRREALERVRMQGAGGGDMRNALAQATYGGVPGHPVLVGREHWARLSAQIAGDAGARQYLRENSKTAVECGDLGGGDDVDTPAGLDPAAS